MEKYIIPPRRLMTAAAMTAERLSIFLPPLRPARWTTSYKAALVAAVDADILTEEAACERYEISSEEFLSWRHAIERYGRKGLRVTRTQIYRNQTRDQEAAAASAAPAADQVAPPLRVAS